MQPFIYVCCPFHCVLDLWKVYFTLLSGKNRQCAWVLANSARAISVAPGYDSSLGRTFPCPSADLALTECESNTRYDNYTSSLMSLSKVVHDRLSVETTDAASSARSGSK